MKKLGKWILIGFLALMAFVYMTNVYDVPWSRKLPAPTPEIVTVTPQRTPAPGEFTNYYTKQRVEGAQAMLAEKLSSANFTVSYRYDNVNGYVFYDLVNPEINRFFIDDVKNNMDKYGDDWDTVSRELVRIQSIIQDTFTDAGDETLVIIDILNPENPDEVWLSVANGIAGYDVVNGVDLLNGQG